MADASPVDPAAVSSLTSTPEVSPQKSEEELAEIRRAFLEKAKARFRVVAEVEATMREKMLEDLRFLEPGGHWPEAIKQDRLQDGRPCLEVDRLTPTIKQVTNQQREMRPAIQINPVDSGADPKTAEVLQGIIRHIETASDADVAYDTAGEHQAKIGRGYWRVLTEYESDETDAQRIVIRRIRNPLSVYLDPAHLQPDGSDARFGFIVEDITDDEFDERFGEGKAKASLTEFTGAGNSQDSAWYPANRIRIAEYFYREDEWQAIVEDPALGRKKLPLETAKQAEADGLVKIVRRISVPHVKWALINATEVLEGNSDLTAGRDWPGKYIPIVPVLGDESDIDGVVNYCGITRRAADTQRMSDYWKSAITETIALAPRAPFIVAEGQLEGHEVEWKLSNRRNFAFLQYKPKTFGNELAPAPQRQAYEPPIQAMGVALQQNEQDLRAVTGYVDVQASEHRSETSGRAILARQKQSELGNSNYLDNLGRAIRHTGRILLDLIPAIYDVPRVLRILGTDDQHRAVFVGSKMPQPMPQGAPQGPQGPQGQPQQPALPPGVKEAFDLSVGVYDVTVSVGPSHQSKRQEAVDSMLQFVQAAPNFMPVIGDLLVKNMDWPGADQIAERLRKTLPPQLQDQPEEQAQIPPQLMAQMQQAQQLIDALTQQVNELKDDSETKKAELASRERIAQIQSETQIAIAQAKTASSEGIALLEARMAGIEQLINLDMARLGAEQQAAMQSQQLAHEAVLSQADQTAAANEAESQRQASAASERFQAMHADQTADKQRQHAVEDRDFGAEQAVRMAKLKPKPKPGGKE